MGMINKKAACALLGVSDRTLARYAEQGRLQTSYRTNEHGREALFDEDELARLKESIDLQRQIISTPAPKESQALALVSRDVSAVEAFAEAIKTMALARSDVRELAAKLALTRKEAAALAGVSESFIRRAIKERRLAVFRDGNIPRIKTADLLDFMKKKL
jgi:excisionase family DNA binding protein